MRILLTTISLAMPGVEGLRIIPEGAVVEGVDLPEGATYGEDQIPLDVATARLAAGTAEPVVDGVTSISSTATAAIAQLASAAQAMLAANLAFLDAAESGTDSDKLALAEALKGLVIGSDDLASRMKAFGDQVEVIRAELAKAAKAAAAKAKKDA
ncbi:hypothetical protein [Caulobacter sp. BP25]|uniref:hypothetical protein n=1 Tax=Caulobacter sp. BP25 TaxID=2048900 RepID=UPI000C12D338|nr:hypothetical protein [Caulobacter sp. BP25]PHY20811.1 hypothetical protein CSW59_06195 [Caulobacter sp. BP25]